MPILVTYPKWWIIKTKEQRKKLMEYGIENTRDLIIAANKKTCEDTDIVVSIRITHLFKFCNEKLGGFHFNMRHATKTEEGVDVYRIGVHTFLSHCKYEEPTTECYGWTQEEIDAFPPECYCPITQQVFKDPVVDCFGFTYERRDIEEWVKNNDTCPLTGEVYEYKQMVPNRIIRGMIERMNA